jgi:hypothetical protein
MLRQNGHQFIYILLVIDVIFFLEPPLVHEKNQVFNDDFVDCVLFRQEGVIEDSFGKFYHALVLQKLVQIQEILKVSKFVFIDFLLDDLYLRQYLVAHSDKLLLIFHLHDLLFANLVFQEGGDDNLFLPHNLQERHVYFYALEPLCFLVNFLYGLEFLNDRVILCERNVFHVNHDLVQRYVIITPQLKLCLHALNQNFINSFIFDVELPLFIVEPIENAFKVGNF